MTNDDLRKQLRTIVAELIEIDEFGDDQRLSDDLGVDSLMSIEIVARIEKRYHLQIPEEALQSLHTFNQIVEVTEAALKAAEEHVLQESQVP
jgi:acyl carrier protein